MKTLAFKDDADGYYQVQVGDDDEPPEWTKALIPCDIQAPQPITGNALILSQIDELEAGVTPRRMREAALGNDNGWLADLDKQIGKLRVQLK